MELEVDIPASMQIKGSTRARRHGGAGVPGSVAVTGRWRAAGFGSLVALVLAAAPVAAAEPDASWLDLVPGADRIGPVEGEPPAAPVFRGEELAGYVLSTRTVVNSTGFSGKPLDVAVGIDTQARITGARVIEQHEPILIIGVKPGDIDAFVGRYVGRGIEEPIRVVRRGAGPGEVDAIAGATVSSLVINNAILTAARAVATSRGLVAGGKLDLATFEPLTFAQLLADGSIVQRGWTAGQIDAQLAPRQATVFPPGDPDDLFVELAAALATPARIGRNLLGDQLYEHVLSELELGDQLIFVAGRGRWSFKGRNGAAAASATACA